MKPPHCFLLLSTKRGRSFGPFVVLDNWLSKIERERENPSILSSPSKCLFAFSLLSSSIAQQLTQLSEIVQLSVNNRVCRGRRGQCRECSSEQKETVVYEGVCGQVCVCVWMCSWMKQRKEMRACKMSAFWLEWVNSSSSSKSMRQCQSFPTITTTTTTTGRFFPLLRA